MHILYYDCFAGISGDMNLGAMIDLGVDKKYLLGELEKLNIGGYAITVTQEQRNGIQGTRFQVHLDGDNHAHDHGRATGPDHDHPHGGNAPAHPAPHTHDDHHAHRNLHDIEQIIDASALKDKVKTLAKAVFTTLAHAEAKIHGKPVDKIHFHEVGAVDSIIDIVGAAVCLDALRVDRVLCSPVELGGGFVTCRHGVLPVPAPATVEILRGVPVKTGAVREETTTPTGAAILATFVDEFTARADFTLGKTGYGIGARETTIPNVLRVCLGEASGCAAGARDVMQETATVIECTIDDMNPELYEHVMISLFNQGAFDTYLSSIIMKKSRPGIVLSVLCNPEKEKEIIETIFKETTTLGLRRYSVDKFNLKREFRKVRTRFGEITLKTAYYNNKILRAKPEYEECKRIAQKHNVAIQDVYNEVAGFLKTDDNE